MTASRVVAHRALLKIRHTPEQLSDVIAVPIIFTQLFTHLLGGALLGNALLTAALTTALFAPLTMRAHRAKS